MLDDLKQLYSKFQFLGFADIAALLKIARIKKINAGEVVIKTGDFNYNNYIVIKGLLRNYIETSSGDERTILLAKEGMNTGSHATIFHDKPATETIRAIEDSVLAMHDVRLFKKACMEHPNLFRLYNEALIMNIDEAIERLSYYTSMNPEERYIHFRDKYPDLIQRVPQIYLASYLGILPGSLSRIRARLSTTVNP